MDKLTMYKDAIYKQAKEKETINDNLRELGIHDDMGKGMLIGTATGIPIGIYDIFKNKDKFKDFTKWQKAKHVTHKSGKYGALGIGAGALYGILRNVVKSRNLNKEASLISKGIKYSYKINKIKDSALKDMPKDTKKKETKMGTDSYKDAIYKEANIGMAAMRMGRALVGGARSLIGKATTKLAPTSKVIKGRLGGVPGSVKQKGLSAQNNIPDRLQGLQTKRSPQDIAGQGYEIRRHSELNRATGRSTPLSDRLEQARTRTQAQTAPRQGAAPIPQSSQPAVQSTPATKADPWWKPSRLNVGLAGAGIGYGLGNIGKGSGDKNIYREASDMSKYKDVIYKMAEVTPVYRANKLQDLMEGFLDYGDTGTPEMRSYFEKDVRNYVEEHPLFNQYVEDEAFNEERYKTKHPHGGKALAGAVAGSAIGSAVLSNLQGAKAVLQNAGARGAALKAFAKGVNPGAVGMGALVGAGIGGIGKLIMDERHRRGIHGPMRDDTWDAMEELPESRMKDLIRENLSVADYSKVMSDKKMADAANAAAFAYKQKAIHDMINSQNNKKASDMTYKDAIYKLAEEKKSNKAKAMAIGAGVGSVAAPGVIHGANRLLGDKVIKGIGRVPRFGKALTVGTALGGALGGAGIGHTIASIPEKYKEKQNKEASDMNKELYKEAKFEAVKKFFKRGPKNIVEGGEKIKKGYKAMRATKPHGYEGSLLKSQHKAYKDDLKGGAAQLGKGVAETAATYGGVPVGAYGAYKIFKKKDTEQDKAANEAYKDVIYKQATVRGAWNAVRDAGKAEKLIGGVKGLKAHGLKEKDAWKQVARGAAETGGLYGTLAGGAYGATKLRKKKKKEEEQDKAANYSNEELYKEAKIGAILKGVGDFVKNRWRGQGIGKGLTKMKDAAKSYRGAQYPDSAINRYWPEFVEGAKEVGKGAVIPGTAGLATGATIHGLRKKKDD